MSKQARAAARVVKLVPKRTPFALRTSQTPAFPHALRQTPTFHNGAFRSGDAFRRPFGFCRPAGAIDGVSRPRFRVVPMPGSIPHTSVVCAKSIRRMRLPSARASCNALDTRRGVCRRYVFRNTRTSCGASSRGKKRWRACSTAFDSCLFFKEELCLKNRSGESSAVVDRYSAPARVTCAVTRRDTRPLFAAVTCGDRHRGVCVVDGAVAQRDSRETHRRGA